MRWFGESWGATACAEADHVPTPVGAPCARCAKPITDGEQGVLVSDVEEMAATPAAREKERPCHLHCHEKASAKTRFRDAVGRPFQVGDEVQFDTLTSSPYVFSGTIVAITHKSVIVQTGSGTASFDSAEIWRLRKR